MATSSHQGAAAGSQAEHRSCEASVGQGERPRYVSEVCVCVGGSIIAWGGVISLDCGRQSALCWVGFQELELCHSNQIQ